MITIEQLIKRNIELYNNYTRRAKGPKLLMENTRHTVIHSSIDTTAMTFVFNSVGITPLGVVGGPVL